MKIIVALGSCMLALTVAPLAQAESSPVQVLLKAARTVAPQVAVEWYEFRAPAGRPGFIGRAAVNRTYFTTAH